MQIDRQKVMKNFVEQKDLMEDKINLGIENNRKGYFKLEFMDEKGTPLKGGKVTVKQLSHDFRFGCNAFKVGCFKKDEQNDEYENLFGKLFNMATLPLYWEDFEPEDGKMRFEKDSPFIDRRIPPELGLEFCRKYSLEPKGHPLFWQPMLPKWLPDDYEEMKHYWIRRLKAISERYDGVFKSFDCINECTTVNNLDSEPKPGEPSYRANKPMSGKYPEWAFEQTEYFFRDSRLVLNETACPWEYTWNKEVSPYYLLADNLINKGHRIDVIGLQYHNFNTPENMPDLAAHYYNPRHLYKVMDTYAKLGRPLSVSEITVPGVDEELQADIIKNLYSIWFSHPAMESIIYWNLGDNCAITSNDREGWSEDIYKSGWFRNDFSKKPVYDVVDDLINNQWQTNLKIDATGYNTYFKAFYGNYEISVERDGKKVTRNLHLSKNGWDTFNFIF